MTINQAFKILSKISDPHIARLIIDATPRISRFKLWCICNMLRKNVPVAKIIHEKWFYGLKFYTNRWTLDPRPDTETLVESVITDCATQQPHRILDLGTGTGCIICALCKHIKNASGVAVDKSWGALYVAKKNITRLGLHSKITLKHSDFSKFKSTEKFDIIVSNPPYIQYGDPRVNEGAKFDPKMALYAKNNGLAAYEQIAKNAPRLIKPNGKIYLEIGINQSKQVIQIFKSHDWRFVRAEQDLSGITRVLVFTI